jgi:hypothetical protein
MAGSILRRNRKANTIQEIKFLANFDRSAMGRDPAFVAPDCEDVHPTLGRMSEQYERETVSKPLPNWGKFAICYRNFRSQRKEYGR